MGKFKKSLDSHFQWQLDYFSACRKNLLDKALEWLKKGEQKKHDALVNEAKKMKFQFNKSECYINYGTCSKKDIDVSFIPNTLQLHTQGCFENRKIES